jgi:hypothetical protein
VQAFEPLADADGWVVAAVDEAYLAGRVGGELGQQHGDEVLGPQVRAQPGVDFPDQGGQGGRGVRGVAERGDGGGGLPDGGQAVAADVADEQAQSVRGVSEVVEIAAHEGVPGGGVVAGGDGHVGDLGVDRPQDGPLGDLRHFVDLPELPLQPFDVRAERPAGRGGEQPEPGL